MTCLSQSKGVWDILRITLRDISIQWTYNGPDLNHFSKSTSRFNLWSFKTSFLATPFKSLHWLTASWHVVHHKLMLSHYRQIKTIYVYICMSHYKNVLTTDSRAKSLHWLTASWHVVHHKLMLSHYRQIKTIYIYICMSHYKNVLTTDSRAKSLQDFKISVSPDLM